MNAKAGNAAGKGRQREAGRRAYIALGSNVGDSARVLEAALGRMRDWSDDPPQCSSLWRSEPVDCPAGSRWFVNAVVGLAPREDETPETLLEKLLALETEFGPRAREVANEPRVLDLDLISFGNEVRLSDGLTLPHPRAHERLFVLMPLEEIAPGLLLPGQDRTVTELVAGWGERAGLMWRIDGIDG